MIIYISGPITNNDDYEDDFARAERYLREAGHITINPAENLADTYREYIDIGLAQLTRADAIYMLLGWRSSAGALLEKTYAETVGMPVLFEKWD